MPVYIYLRAVRYQDEDHLAMFDSNGEGAIDDLTTVVEAGNTIYWKLDSHSRIVRINKIYSKHRGRVVFAHDAEPHGRSFKIRVPRNINKGHKKPIVEKYFIDCKVEYRNKPLKIDPYIKIPPP